MDIDDIKQIKPDQENTAQPQDAPKAEKIEEVQEGAKDAMAPLSEKDKTTDIPKINMEGNGQPASVSKKKWMPSFNFNFQGRNKKILIGIAAFFVLLIILVIAPSIFVYQKAMAFYGAGQKLTASVQSQNLDAIKTELSNTQKAQKSLASTYKLILWTKFIPFVGGYTADGEHAIAAAGYGLDAANLVLETAQPYADILGLKGNSNVLGTATTGEETTQERIDFIIKTLPDLVPKIDGISAKVELARNELDKINPNRYPATFRGKPVREQIAKGIETVDTADKYVKNGKPLLSEASYLLGLDSPRTYLVLFQNDKELRPTGGFMTAYSIMKVDKARFEPVSSSDIYTLDAKYNPSIPAPQPIIDYIKGPYVLDKDLRLRDMNWSPDFAESMKLFTTEAQKVGIKNIDGVIGVDTQMLVNILDVIGPIGVSGYGNFSTDKVPECDCPQVIHELESFADVEGPIVWDPNTGEIVYRPPHSDNRKAIIGPLMNSILANALGQPKDKIAPLFEAGFKSLAEKHVLFYMFDDKAQNAVEAFDIAGKIDDYPGDYLEVNDANLGGRKSNLYVTQDVEQNITVNKDGSVEKTVTITYKNPAAQDGWLNSVLPNWVRVYVPKGSELISSDGLENSEKPYDDLGKTVFAGYFELRPQGVAKVTFRYKLPMKMDKTYNLLLEKQPGKDKPLYTINIGKKRDDFYLTDDKELHYSL